MENPQANAVQHPKPEGSRSNRHEGAFLRPAQRRPAGQVRLSQIKAKLNPKAKEQGKAKENLWRKGVKNASVSSEERAPEETIATTSIKWIHKANPNLWGRNSCRNMTKQFEELRLNGQKKGQGQPQLVESEWLQPCSFSTRKTMCGTVSSLRPPLTWNLHRFRHSWECSEDQRGFGRFAWVSRQSRWDSLWAVLSVLAQERLACLHEMFMKSGSSCFVGDSSQSASRVRGGELILTLARSTVFISSSKQHVFTPLELDLVMGRPSVPGIPVCESFLGLWPNMGEASSSEARRLNGNGMQALGPHLESTPSGGGGSGCSDAFQAPERVRILGEWTQACEFLILHSFCVKNLKLNPMSQRLRIACLKAPSDKTPTEVDIFTLSGEFSGNFRITQDWGAVWGLVLFFHVSVVRHSLFVCPIVFLDSRGNTRTHRSNSDYSACGPSCGLLVWGVVYLGSSGHMQGSTASTGLSSFIALSQLRKTQEAASLWWKTSGLYSRKTLHYGLPCRMHSAVSILTEDAKS